MRGVPTKSGRRSNPEVEFSKPAGLLRPAEGGARNDNNHVIINLMKSILKLTIYLLILIILSHLALVTYWQLKIDKPTVLSSQSIAKRVTVFGQVGEYHLTIEGYTSPFALVELSTGLFTVSEMRSADNTGYFIFRNILLHPFLSNEPCLIATDKNHVFTPPLCLPQIPRGRDVFITGVILAPSLILEKGESESGRTTPASGYATPNSSVDLYLFRQEKKHFWESWIRKAEAKGTPRFSFQSNKKGYFEFNLPSYLPTTYRLFVASNFCPGTKRCGSLPCTDWCGVSPKSNTLKFKVLNFWEKIILSIYNLLYLLVSIILKFIKNPLFLYLLEIGVIILLIFLLWRKKKNLALVKLPKRELITIKK